MLEAIAPAVVIFGLVVFAVCGVYVLGGLTHHD